MFCEDCGFKNPDDALFCSKCGKAFNKRKNKNMLSALILSFLISGLGIIYAGNTKKGAVLLVLGLLFNILGLASGVFTVIGFVIWIYSLYETYNQVEIANGNRNPNLLKDWQNWSRLKKMGSLIAVIVILFIVFAGIIGALIPHEDVSPHYSSSGVSSSNGVSPTTSGGVSQSSSSVSSSSDKVYTSSSNGRDVESHYEGEHGSSDTYGTVYNDGSVESHQTGHTDYGDYQIDSYMDSDGNIHGTVDVGGRTYNVNT